MQNAIGITSVIVLLLAFRPLMERRLQPQARYAAWLIVIILSLVPLGGLAEPLWTIAMPEQRTPIVYEKTLCIHAGFDRKA